MWSQKLSHYGKRRFKSIWQRSVSSNLSPKEGVHVHNGDHLIRCHKWYIQPSCRSYLLVNVIHEPIIDLGRGISTARRFRSVFFLHRLHNLLSCAMVSGHV